MSAVYVTCQNQTSILCGSFFYPCFAYFLDVLFMQIHAAPRDQQHFFKTESRMSTRAGSLENVNTQPPLFSVFLSPITMLVKLKTIVPWGIYVHVQCRNHARFSALVIEIGGLVAFWFCLFYASVTSCQRVCCTLCNIIYSSIMPHIVR